MDFISPDSFLNFLAHVGTGLGLILLGIIAFAFTTKFSEWELIKAGNIAVALKLWGKVIGLGITLYTVWSGSVNLLDAFIWGLVGIITQVVVYFIIEYILTPRKTNLAQKVEEGNMAVGFSLFAVGITVGLVVAGSLTY
jgi:putative membrane protein